MYLSVLETYLRTYVFTAQTAEAMKRAVVQAIGLFLVTTGGALVTHAAIAVAIGMGLAAAAGAFGIRGGVEGIYDSRRQFIGKSIPGDVVREAPPGVPVPE